MSEIELAVEIERKQRSLRFPEGSTVENMLSSLGLYPDAHIVIRGKMPVPLDEVLVPGDVLRIIKVASGG